MTPAAWDHAPVPPVEFLFDYASPFSFLANETLAARLPGAEIAYRPVYLRGMDAFAKGIPYGPAKLAWVINDLRRCAAECGIEMRIPATFPVNGLYALRGAIAAQRAGRFAAYHDAVFRATWQMGRDISHEESLVALATELGFPEAAAAVDDPSIKDELRANTEDAIRRGVFGVPTFFAHGPSGAEMFWGHDRMHQVAKLIVS
ncbi:MAG: 2-hydroxychromene-2-carboxylate isomerase [Deltaproteobacteria bacterium]|nr:2-hydroxychromene-2-carboxylate isomerase [Deltaproteobacteria bacterium]